LQLAKLRIEGLPSHVRQLAAICLQVPGDRRVKLRNMEPLAKFHF
jgi:hypothetical protein